MPRPPRIVITRLSDHYTRRIRMHDHAMLCITRYFVQEGRKHHYLDRFITRKTHIVLLRRGHRIHLYNQHENEVGVIGEPNTFVHKSDWVRVDGKVVTFSPYYHDMKDLEFHIELDDPAEEESLPPTPKVEDR